MKKIFFAVVTIFTSLVPTTAVAAIINGNFENGFNGWQTLGDYRTETSGSNIQAFLSTAFNEVIDVNLSGEEIRGGNAAPATFITGIAENSLEAFLNTSRFFGDDFLTEAIEGSAIKQTFTARAGETLSFDWNFLTNELVGSNANPDFNDFAFATLSNSSQNLFFKLADTTTGFLASGSRSLFDEETGLQTFSYTLPTDGEYTLGLGVVDVGEPTVISALLVDNVQSVGRQAVPEFSSTVGLLFFGTVGVVSLLKRTQKR